MNQNNLEDFFTFVLEREALRINKLQHPDHPQQWTTNEILRVHRFCNVNREHDAVTIWIEKNLREFFHDKSLGLVVPSLFLARIYNEPETLKHILPELRFGYYDRSLELIKELRANGQKAMRGAYMVAPHGPKGKGRTPEEYFTEATIGLYGSIVNYGSNAITSFEELAEIMARVNGVGPFFINQVVADLRYMPQSENFPDWGDFILAGPGTRRGLNRLADRKLHQGVRNQVCKDELLEVRELALDALPKVVWDHFRDINNLSNCFCEYDKYCRGREQYEQGKRLTLRRYK